jgi:hypothetical protein
MTLKEIIATIEELGNKHLMIATTYNGAAMDRLALSDVEYPMFTFDVSNARISGQTIEFDFSMFFFDRLQADASNEREVQSDQLSIAEDIIAQLKYGGWDSFVLSDNVPIVFFTDNTPEMLAGVNATATVIVDFIADRCSVPTTFVF